MHLFWGPSGGGGVKNKMSIHFFSAFAITVPVQSKNTYEAPPMGERLRGVVLGIGAICMPTVTVRRASNFVRGGTFFGKTSMPLHLLLMKKATHLEVFFACLKIVKEIFLT